MARARVLVMCVALLGGCDRVYGLHRPPEPDAEILPDARVCFGTALVQLCLVSAPPEMLDVPSGLTVAVNTDGQSCEPYVGDPGWCVVSGETVTIEGTLRGSGPLPLVVIATTRLTVSGSVDVASGTELGAGGDLPVCATGIGGGANSGGGAGGTFGGKGGGGGDASMSGQGGNAAAVTVVSTLRGGCRGGSGANSAMSFGHGGGAVYLIAGTELVIAGTVDASGGGGQGGTGATVPGGGGGGGAGGMIGLDAPSITITGTMLANGGGGGEGGGDPFPGNAGASPTAPGTMAKGGAAGTINGGDGGDGAAGANTTGLNGHPGTNTSNAGGGGGGGGGGIIRIYPRQGAGANVSPPPT